MIVRQSLDAPLSQVRDFASSDLGANPELRLAHIGPVSAILTEKDEVP